MSDPYHFTASAATSWPQAATHGEAIAAVVARWGEKPAVVGPEGTLSYSELQDRAWALARRLHAYSPLRRVALLGPNVQDYVVGQAAIYAAGTCGVLLDSANPVSRLRQMLSLSEADALMLPRAQAALAAELEDLVCGAVVWIDDDACTSAPDIPLRSPDDDAIIVFTSGSTGAPKGSLESEGDSLERCRLYGDLLGLSPGRVVGVVHHFGGSRMQPYSALTRGAAVAMYDFSTLGFGALPDWATEFHVDTVRLFPTAFRQLCAGLAPGRQLPSLKTLVLTGEAVYATDIKLLRRVAPQARLVSVYSSTETGPVAAFEVLPDDPLPADGPLPLGWPLRGKRVDIVSSGGRAANAADVAGEIQITSQHLFTGYIGDHTAALADDPETGQSCFAIGDRAYWDNDGRLCHAGRTDSMIKIRGNRLELAEVEQALMRLTDVVHVAAVSYERAEGILSLAAYIVVRPDSAQTASTLREELSLHLPSWMMPSRVLMCAELPLGTTGKVQRSALTPTTIYPRSVPFADATEAALAAIWSDLLGDVQVQSDTDFFLAGGDSLLAATALLDVEATFGVRLPLTVFAEHSTLQSLSTLIGTPGAHGAEPSLVPISVAGSEKQGKEVLGARATTVFCIAGIRGHVLRFVQIRDELPGEIDLYGLQPPGLTWPDATTIEVMAAHYIKQLRGRQDHGPYHLIGASFGGLVAYEVARQLERDGDTVAWIIMLDTSLPGIASKWDWRGVLDADAVHSQLVRAHREADERFCSTDETPTLLSAQLHYLMALEHPVCVADERDWRPYFAAPIRYYPVSGMHGAFHALPQRPQVARIVSAIILDEQLPSLSASALFTASVERNAMLLSTTSDEVFSTPVEVHHTPCMAHVRGAIAASDASQIECIHVYVDRYYYGWTVLVRSQRDGNYPFDIKIQHRALGASVTLTFIGSEGLQLARVSVVTEHPHDS
jgi:acyl-coenzyme A synthetase/AMP-(fatty) acid ligase/surfactin synthase thioesterase subunit/acyl carrier protein